jgi:transposase-like protein
MYLTAYELIKRFPDEKSAMKYLEFVRWRGKPVCPRCGHHKGQYKQRRRCVEGYYRCQHCLLVYTVRTGTLFERSHVSLDKWLFALYCAVKSQHRLSPTALAREIDVTVKTARQLIDRIRSHCVSDRDLFLKQQWSCLFEKPSVLELGLVS